LSDPLVVLAAESWLRERALGLTEPHAAECLFCFVARMLDEHGCDTTLRWATRYRDLRAPRATALENRLYRMGGFCDCEIFLNGMTLAPRLLPPLVQLLRAYPPEARPGTYADETFDPMLELLEVPPSADQQEIDELEAIAELETVEARWDIPGLRPRPACSSTRRGSTRPCTNWVRQPRRW
jgi:hypothetical protein